MTTAGSMHEAGHPKLVPCNNPEGWGGGGERWEGDSGWWDVHNTAISCQCMANTTKYCKVISLQ